MIYTSPSNYYSLSLPPSWRFEEHENIVSFYNTDSLGALNISSYRIPNNYSFDSGHELIEFIEASQSSFDDIIRQDIEGKQIAFLQLQRDDTYWLYYVIYFSNKALFITYNCDYIDKDKETDLVDLIVKSIVVPN